jgi:hypothetical protein
VKNRVVAIIFVFALVFSAAHGAGAATIHVTYLKQKIAGQNTGGCSLQEAIYSSVLHDTLDGTHGVAIDATDQGTPPDHFITTDCEKGDGNDTIILPTKGMLEMDSDIDWDAYNPVGPTATPVICCSTITVEGNGATLQWNGTGNARLFAVIGDSVKANGGDEVKTPNGSASGVANLTLKNVYVTGFHVKGGDSLCGGGGGSGAGGAIYVWGAYLTVENSTFDGNKAFSGRGWDGVVYKCPGEEPFFGGGAGLGGNGGTGAGAGAGGGGSRGGGGQSALNAGGGGGGGTVFAGGNANGNTGGASGYFCGGNGGDEAVLGTDGHPGKCPGGGGGGGGFASGGSLVCGANGGDGSYGGGGGGGEFSTGGVCHGDGGRGGFGGGGGAAGGTGGDGGFGGGGGIGFNAGGHGGFFGGDADFFAGNGGALGGAIFNDSGTVTIRNSTFTNNVTSDPDTDPDLSSGAAIFSHDGSLTIENSTISKNCAGDSCRNSGGGLVVFGQHSASLTLNNTIMAWNASAHVPGSFQDQGECYVQGTVTVQGAGNLILDNTLPGFNYARPFTSDGGPVAVCPGVVSSTDPELGALADNGGFTRTMAIPFGSVAMSAADSATSLATDQRGEARPQADGWDIGAYEVCRKSLLGNIRPFFCSETTFGGFPTSPLTIAASASGGSTSPAPGIYNEPQNTVVVLTANPTSGYYLKNWTGNVVAPNSALTTIIIGDQAQSVTANFQLHDFTLLLGATSLTLPLDGSGSTTVTGTALGDFADKLGFSDLGQPAGAIAPLYPITVSPVVGVTRSSTLTFTLGPSVTPQSFNEMIRGNSTGASGALTHSASLSVTVVATAASLVNVITQEQSLGCMDSSGIGQSLIAKVNTYQSLATKGHMQGATNVLAAFQYEGQAQTGQHIATTCTDPVGGNQFSTGQTLMADAQSLQATVGAQLKPDPIVGSVLNSGSAGIPGATVNLLSGKTVLAITTTDALGFYYFADTTVLTRGANYTVSVTLPKGYKTSTPASQTLTWSAGPVGLRTFVLN